MSNLGFNVPSWIESYSGRNVFIEDQGRPAQITRYMTNTARDEWMERRLLRLRDWRREGKLRAWYGLYFVVDSNTISSFKLHQYMPRCFHSPAKERVSHTHTLILVGH